jgi:hypothetical protein
VNYNPVKNNVYVYKKYVNTILDIEHIEMLRKVRQQLIHGMYQIAQ